MERRRQWHPTPVLLPGKSHGRRNLEGCSPWGRWGSDTTERLHFRFSFSSIGGGNGNPLQCSCLENPRDRGAWWAAVYGVAQSWTWLKRLSSSSSIWKFNWFLYIDLIFYNLAAAKLLQSCLTPCDPIDGTPPGSPVPGILQARTLERVAISFSNAWEWKVKGKSLSHVRLFETPWTAAFQAPPSMGFSRQEYWSGVPLPSPTILLNWFIRFDTYFVDSISFYICNHVISK